MRSPGTKSVLTQMPGWRLERSRNDSMRCNNLGTSHHAIGNGLKYLATAQAFLVLPPAVGRVIPHDAKPAVVLDDLEYRFKAWLRENRLHCSFRKFTEHSISDRGAPYYKSKAAQSPVFIAWLASITADFAAACSLRDRPTAQKVSLMFWAKAEFYHVMKTSDRFFNPEQLDKFLNAGTTFLYMWSDLRRDALASNEVAWSMVPKFHQLHHILIDAKTDSNNPRFFHCFGDEDCVGQVLTLARSGHGLTVVDSALDKYLLGFGERLINFTAEDDT